MIRYPLRSVWIRISRDEGDELPEIDDIESLCAKGKSVSFDFILKCRIEDPRYIFLQNTHQN